MNLIAKGILFAAIAGVPTSTAFILNGSDEAVWPSKTSQSEFADALSLRPKDESRVSTLAVTSKEDKGSLLVQLAQASRVVVPAPKAGQSSQLAEAFPPVPLSPAQMHPGARPALPPFMGPPPPMTRSACEDRINREIAVAAFIKSKLRLQPQQREAWRKIEDVAQPAIDKLHSACDGLPVEASLPPSLPDTIDATVVQLLARAELLKAVREPIRALFDTLSPEQRAALQPPPLQPIGPGHPL